MPAVITKPELELEGTWEEILTHASELTGRKLRVLVLPAPPLPTENKSGENVQETNIPPQKEQALAQMRRWRETALTDEDMAVLNDMEEFTNAHRFTLRQNHLEL